MSLEVLVYEHYVSKFILNDMSFPGTHRTLMPITYLRTVEGQIRDVRMAKSPVSFRRVGGLEDYTRNVIPRIDPAVTEIEVHAAPALSDMASGRRIRADRLMAAIRILNMLPMRTPGRFAENPNILDFMTSLTPREVLGFSSLIVRSRDIGTFVNLENPDITGGGPYYSPGYDTPKPTPGQYRPLLLERPSTVLYSMSAINRNDFIGLYAFLRKSSLAIPLFYRTVVIADWRHIRKLLYHSSVEGEQTIVVNPRDAHQYKEWLDGFASRKLHGLEPKVSNRNLAFRRLPVESVHGYHIDDSAPPHRWFQPFKIRCATNLGAVRAISGYVPAGFGGGTEEVRSAIRDEARRLISSHVIFFNEEQAPLSYVSPMPPTPGHDVL